MFVANVSAAMLDLSNLLAPSANPKQMSWSMAWLKELGLKEANPVTLFLFGTKWQHQYLAIRESLEEISKII